MAKISLMKPKTLMNIIIGTCILAALTTLLQVWFSFFNSATFGKLLLTYGIVLVLAAILKAIQSDLDDEADKKDNNYFN